MGSKEAVSMKFVKLIFTLTICTALVLLFITAIINWTQLIYQHADHPIAADPPPYAVDPPPYAEDPPYAADLPYAEDLPYAASKTSVNDIPFVLIVCKGELLCFIFSSHC